MNTVKTDTLAKIKADNIFFFNNGKLPCHRCIKLKRGQHTRTCPDCAQGDGTVPRGASVATRCSCPMPKSCKAGCEWQRNDLERAQLRCHSSPSTCARGQATFKRCIEQHLTCIGNQPRGRRAWIHRLVRVLWLNRRRPVWVQAAPRRSAHRHPPGARCRPHPGSCRTAPR